MMKMSSETAAALEASIDHWKRLRGDPFSGGDTKGRSCALCSLFAFGVSLDSMCSGCPVVERTGFRRCQGSPWVDANRAFENVLNRYADGTPEGRRKIWDDCARVQIDFLESLREEATP